MSARRILRRATAATICSLLLLPAAATADTPSPSIETVGGEVPSGILGTSASVTPAGMDHDAAGNLYASDPGQGVVWKMDTGGTIHHFAGMGRVCAPDPARCISDHRPATEAFLAGPAGLAVGPDGDVFLAEMRGHRVRRIDGDTGMITTYAGTGSDAGYSEASEGAAATETPIWMPQDLAFDSEGRLYVTSLGHRRIYRIDTDGTIRSVAGCGSWNPQTCSASAQDGAPVEGAYIGANGGLNGNGWAIAVSPADELYIADTAQIVKLDEQSTTYRTVAGRWPEYASFPGQGEDGPAIDARFGVTVAMDFAPNGDLFLMEGGGTYTNPWNRVQRIEAPAGPQSIVRHVGGNGTGDGYTGEGGNPKQARFAFSQPTGTWTGQGLSVGPTGKAVVGDIKNHRVREIDVAAGRVDTIAGNGHGAPAATPRGINSQTPSSFTVGLVARGGFSGDGGPAALAQMYLPSDLEADRHGNLYVLDGGNNRVRRIGPDGTITTVAGSGCVSAYCAKAPLGDGGPADAAGLDGPTAIALDRTGTQLYIADRGARRVRQANLGTAPFTAYPLSQAPVVIQPGEIETVVGPGRSVATPGAPWGPSYQGCALVKPYCGEGLHASEYSPSSLQGLAADSAGNLYFSDAYTSQVLQVEAATGIVTTVAGLTHTSECSGDPDTGLPGRATQLCGPTSLAIGPDDDLYIAESSWMGFGESLRYGWIDTGGPESSRIRHVDLQDPLRTSTLVAGGGAGAVGFGGDGGPATDATLAFPHGIAVAPDGTIYFADTGNSRIRAIAPDGTIDTVTGAGRFLDFGVYDGCDLGGDGGQASDAILCAPLGVALGADGDLYVADTLNGRVRAIRGL